MQLLQCTITLHQSSELLAHKYLHCLLLQHADPWELTHSRQGSMISNSTKKSCMRVNAFGSDSGINGRLHLLTLCRPARRWHAHGAIGVQRPWISGCSEVGNK